MQAPANFLYFLYFFSHLPGADFLYPVFPQGIFIRHGEETEGTVYQLKNSFVENIKDVSPGIILTIECLERYFNKKVKCIDYLGVTNSVKSRVSNDSLVACNVRLYRKNIVNYGYTLIKFKIWPKIENSSFAQNVKNFILRKSHVPVEEVSRKAYLKK